MNPTVSQVATPTTAIFPEQPMADIIDSLKRLERLGDENSKTVQKILQAAQDIENRVLELFDSRPIGTTIDCKDAFGKVPNSPLDVYRIDKKKRAERAAQIGLAPELYDRSYVIGEADGRRHLMRRLSGRDEWVAENRDSALRFADDIAGGLLIAIAADLARQKGNNAAALATLAAAKELLQVSTAGREQNFSAVLLTPAIPDDAHNRACTLIERCTGRKAMFIKSVAGPATRVILDSPLKLDSQAKVEMEHQIADDVTLRGVRVELL